MFIKRHHRKTLITDLYTIEANKEQYYYIVYTNGNKKLVSTELRTQSGEHIKDQNLELDIKNLVMSKQ